jgi:phosphoribosylamine--glycine ligase
LLYCGLIVTARGIRVIEFNARFGDPETQVVLRRLTTPLSTLLYKAASGHLETAPDPQFSKDVAITVVLASEGYPETSAPNRPIYGIGDAEREGAEVCHASTTTVVDEEMSASNISQWQAAKDDGEEALLATGGRVLSVVATGSDFKVAREQAYRAIEKIQLQGSHYRKDIAAKVAN